MNTQNKNPNQSAQKYENLQRFARNLVEDAKSGKLDPVIGLSLIHI